MTHGATHSPDLSQTQQRFAGVAPMLFFGGLVAAAVGFAIAVLYGSLVQHDWHRVGLAYLTAYCFFFSISLAALFFVVVQHLVRAGWSVVVRRIAEVMALNLVTLALLVIPIIVFVKPLYHHWAQPHAYDAILVGKSAWLNPGFFCARLVIYLAVAIYIAWYHWSASVEQDRTGDRAITLRLQGIAGLWVALVALIMTFASFDLIMSLDPHWYSTMFGVYFFAGGFGAFFATTVLVSRFLQNRGILEGVVTTEHYHDLGKWMFAFTFFWGYIVYSQYMLIWYGSIPEEVQWFARRGATTNLPETGGMAGWGYLSVVLLVGHLFLPFLALLTRWTKRRLVYLSILAVWMLAFHYIDLYWQIMPELNNDATPYEGVMGPGWITELAMLVGVGGCWVAGLARLASKSALVPTGDPRLQESLSFQNF